MGVSHNYKRHLLFDFDRKKMKKDALIYIAGHTGLVGSALVRKLQAEGYENLVLRARADLDLRDQDKTFRFFSDVKPNYVFFAAGRVGGIRPNIEYPGEFIRDNIVMQTNVIEAAHREGVEKLLYVASCCAYPTDTPQPIRENQWLTGRLEPTNEPFAIAKIAGVGMCQAYARQYGVRFISVVPTNLFGPHDDFDPSTAHLVGQTMALMHDAKIRGLPRVTLGGTGLPVRDFMHSDDLADAALFLMKEYNSPELINIGTGQSITKRGIVEKIGSAISYEGEIAFDASKPDGMMRRELDVSKLGLLGWKSKIDLDDALRETYESYVRSLS